MKVFDSSFCAAQPFVPMLPLPSRSRTTSIGLCRHAFVRSHFGSRASQRGRR